jgi:hypothetical protein
MTKTRMICPFSHELCGDCPVYRGRHYYLNLCRQYDDDTNEHEDDITSGGLKRVFNPQVIKELVEQWAGDYYPTIELDTEVEVIDMDIEEKRTVTLGNMKDWEWNNNKTIRMIDGVQITSWEQLVQLISYKMRKGDREIKLYEAPHFMLISGG